MKRILILLILCVSLSGNAQNVIGYWYGSGNISNGLSANNYLVELILKQNNTNVQGIMNYYFRNTFRSIKINGNYNQGTRELSLFNVPVPFYGSTSQMEVDCMMDLVATLRVARAGSNLNGRMVGRDAYKYTCPDIIFDLKLNEDAGNQDSILAALRNFKETHQVWTPSATDTLVAATIINRPVVNYVVVNQFKERQKEVAQQIVVEGDSLLVDFYDNGEVDGDSISIFVNDQLIAFNRLLSTKAVHFTLKLDPTREVNEITMFADNLGSLPPNTALMLVYDGMNRHEVRMSSSLQKNATLHIRRKKK
jgi:hypothetical protein